METQKILDVEAAIAIIHDDDVIATSGYGGCGTPEYLLTALGERFEQSGTPRNLTLVHSTGQGDAEARGLNHLAKPGLLKRIIGGYYGLSPKTAEMAVKGEVEAYNFPEGCILQLYRAIAGGKPGILSKVGLGTFVDPRIDGGKVNDITTEDLVELMHVGGEEWLFYKAFPINVAFIRGTTADPEGNVTIEREALKLEDLSLAMAAKNSGGYVICQVERIAERGSLTSKLVHVPGIMVDCIVVAEPEQHMQSYGTVYNPAFSGETKIPLEYLQPLPLDDRKIIARRCALELDANGAINLGFGMPTMVAAIANEEKIHNLITLCSDTGLIGGVPAGGLDLGAGSNHRAMIDHLYQYDFIDGGGLDLAVLGMAQCDSLGNINASRFGGRLMGCGGFINISQNSRKVVFVGTFTAGGLKTEISEGKIHIQQEGKNQKFIEAIDQITFSGEIAAQDGKEVYYITERCVFKLLPGGISLIEVAPGIDIDRDILSAMGFTPIIDNPKTMDTRIFHPESMDLKTDLLGIPLENRISYNPYNNTMYFNFAGLQLNSQEDIDTLGIAVEAQLKPLGKRVHSIVNYDSFYCKEELLEPYADLVRHIDKTYYLSVSRYTTSAFLRLKLGKELSKRQVAPHIHETQDEAKKSARGRHVSSF